MNARQCRNRRHATILGRMTAGDGKACVILPKTCQKLAGYNYRSNKCPCMDPKIENSASVIGCSSGSQQELAATPVGSPLAFQRSFSSLPTALLVSAQSPPTGSYIFCMATPRNRCRTGIAALPSEARNGSSPGAELLKVFRVNVLMVEYRSTLRWINLRGIHHG